MENKFYVTIVCHNAKTSKFHEVQDDFDSMVNVTRALLTFKPKRGYRVCNVIIDCWERLV